VFNLSNRNRSTDRATTVSSMRRVSTVEVELLENRRLLSVGHPALLHHAEAGEGIGQSLGHRVQTIVFSAAPSAVQKGLQAITPSGTTIASTQTVYVRTISSTTTDYSVKVTSSSGPSTRLTVDENGLPAGEEKVLFSQLSASTAPANDQAIAAALQKLAPSGTTIAGSQTVFVHTVHGQTNYSVALTNSNGTVTRISVNASGTAVTPPNHLPTGPNTILFSAVPAAVQAGLKAIAPSGTTISSSQQVLVRKVNSTTTDYTIQLSGGGEHNRLTVDENGLPAGEETVLYSQLSASTAPANDRAIAAGLQKLAPSGVTIAGSQSVFVHAFNGATTFTIFLTNSSGTVTRITVDSSGNAVTLPTPTPPTPPTRSTIQFSAALPAVQKGLQALAPSGTTIGGTQSVFVVTLSSGKSYYTIFLPGASSEDDEGSSRITVDQNGLPAGEENVLFSQLSASTAPANDQAIATALQKLAPSGTTIAGTQMVLARTVGGTTTFTVNLTASNGSVTTISVDSSGNAVTPPISSGRDHEGDMGFEFSGFSFRTFDMGGFALRF